MCPIYPTIKIFFENSSDDPESAVLHDPSYLLSSIKLSNTPHGLFNDKYPLHTIPHPTKQNILTNRISYSIESDSYYENGTTNKKYLEFWDQGALYHKNLVYVTDHFDDGYVYLNNVYYISPVINIYFLFLIDF